jgi:chromosomal replication initiation ATPase DnaA
LPSQIPLPLEPKTIFTRENFIVSAANADAAAFIESWPSWTVSAAALYGPAGSGKTHFVEVWKMQSGAQSLAAAALSGSAFTRLDRARPVAIEDVDDSVPNPARDAALFHLIDSATLAHPLVLTGHAPPSHWPVTMPDLASRFAALVAFSISAPDDALLAQLAEKLFAERQLSVPQAVVSQMLKALERSPAAVRDFVDRLDERALAEKRPVTAALVRELLAEQGTGPS